MQKDENTFLSKTGVETRDLYRYIRSMLHNVDRGWNQGPL